MTDTTYFIIIHVNYYSMSEVGFAVCTNLCPVLLPNGNTELMATGTLSLDTKYTLKNTLCIKSKKNLQHMMLFSLYFTDILFLVHKVVLKN